MILSPKLHIHHSSLPVLTVTPPRPLLFKHLTLQISSSVRNPKNTKTHFLSLQNKTNPNSNHPKDSNTHILSLQNNSGKPLKPRINLSGQSTTSLPPLTKYVPYRKNWFLDLAEVYGLEMVVMSGLSYWVQGFRCFPWLALNFYFKDGLGVDLATLQLVQYSANLPMVAKPIYGLVTDSVYIGDAHRLPYISLGVLLQAFSWGSIALLPFSRLNISALMALILLSNLGASITEVASDALLAECSKKCKIQSSSGVLQSLAFMALALGGIMGNLWGGIILEKTRPTVMFLNFVFLLLLQLFVSSTTDERSLNLPSPGPSVPLLKQPISKITENQPSSTPILSLLTEPIPKITKTELPQSLSILEKPFLKTVEKHPVHPVPNATLTLIKNPMSETIKKQFSDLKRAIKDPSISRPLSWAVASTAIVPILSGTLFYFQTEYLKVGASKIGLSKVIGQALVLTMTVLYNQFLRGVPVRGLVFAVQILYAASFLFDLVLVKQLNLRLGISNEAHVLWISALGEAISQFKILPFTVFLANQCPLGLEGSLLAFFMSALCLASIFSGYVGVVLASFMGVSSNGYGSLPVAIGLQFFAALVPLLWISYVPSSKILLKKRGVGRKVGR
ncbi:hypothetical protein AMTRI_Chr07g25840 [Amborella trichopoda]